MKNNETTNLQNNKPDVEDLIVSDILSSHKNNLKNISKTDLEVIIKEKVIKADYLNEGWPVNYAVMRITEAIKRELKITDIIKEKTDRDIQLKKMFAKYKILNYSNLFSIIVGVIGLFYAGLILGGLAMALGALAKEGKQKLATLGIAIGAISFFGAMIMLTALSRSKSYLTSASVVFVFYMIFGGKSKREKEDEREAMERMQSITKK